MNSKYLLKNWGNQFSQLLKEPMGEQSKSQIKQKDLAQALGVRESNITAWKRGEWDIHLSNVYAIAEYVKRLYPDSTPMLTLFSDLLNDEIDKIINPIVTNYEKTISELTTKLNEEIRKESVETYNELDSDYNELQDEYDKLKIEKEGLEKEFSEIRCSFEQLNPKLKKYLRKKVPNVYHERLGLKEKV